MAKFELRPAFTSRHKQTALYMKGGKAFYGVWKSPDIKMEGDEKEIIVTTDQEGQLDLYAYNEYGDRSLFWAIAYVNNIQSISDEVVAGMRLKLPHYDNVKAALTDTGHE